MKIIFLSYSYWPPNFGGELLITEERLQDLSMRGHQIIVLTAGAEGFPSTAFNDGVEVHRSPLIGKNRFSRILRRIIFWFWSIRELLFSSKIDILHFNSMPGFGKISSNLYGGLASWIAHKKNAKTIYVHSLASEEGNYFTLNAWGKIFFSGIDHIVCVSDGLYQVVKTIFPNKAIKIICGVHEDSFVPLSGEVRDQFRLQNGVNESDVIFSFLGSIGERKGFDLIAKAFSEDAAQHKNWRLWVIGPRTRAENQNIDEKEVAQLTAPLIGIGNIVKYWGRINDRSLLAEILASSDVFLFPSRKEGFGLAPLEAMSVAVPPVVAKIPGVTDLANVHGETGLYITPGNLVELKSAMLKLAEDPALREAMGRKARHRIVEHFSWRQHIDRWEQLYLGNLHDE